jgi:hypothetical protein
VTGIPSSPATGIAQADASMVASRKTKHGPITLRILASSYDGLIEKNTRFPSARFCNSRSTGSRGWSFTGCSIQWIDFQ